MTAMKYNPKFCYRFNIEEIDFIVNEELQNLKIFAKKDESVKQCNYMNLSSIFEIEPNNLDMEAYSLKDFIKLAQTKPEMIQTMTFQIKNVGD